jgi:hypothetical protein
VKIWFNKNLSSTSYVIERIREAAAAQGDCSEYRIICTHSSADASVTPVADFFALEPTGLGAAGYVEWCLAFARENAVDVFIPRNYSRAIAEAADKFAALGVTLILAAADAPTYDVIAHKGLFYDALRLSEGVAGQGQFVVPVPAFCVVDHAEAFAIAYGELSARHNRVCVKPAEGIGGKGFRIITTGGDKIFSTWDNKEISADYGEYLAEASAEVRFPELMMMEHLPGQERSVDCLARDGKLLAAVVRLKSWDGVEELLEENPLLVEYCRRITAKVGLTGLYNVQFMEADGKQYLLEVNSRMSGGIHYGALSGVCLPYWAIRVAAGTADVSDIPVPRTGIRVSRKTRTVIGA